MKSSLEIAQDATLQPIEAIAERTGLLPEESSRMRHHAVRRPDRDAPAPDDTRVVD